MDSLKLVKVLDKFTPTLKKNPLKDTTNQIKIYIDQEKCIGCGLCREICPFGLPEQDKNKRYSISKINECIECSACKRNCPVQAIIMIEKSGCGCLWDVHNRTKILKNKNSLTNLNSCC